MVFSNLSVSAMIFAATVGITATYTACSQAPGSQGLTSAANAAAITVDMGSVNDLLNKGLSSPHLATYNAAMLKISPADLRTTLATFVTDGPVSIGGHTVTGLRSKLLSADAAAMDRSYPTLKDMFAAASIDPAHPFAKQSFDQYIQNALTQLDPKAGHGSLALIAPAAAPTVGGVPTESSQGSSSSACTTVGVLADVLHSNSGETKVTGEVGAGSCIALIATACGVDAAIDGVAGTVAPGIGNIIGGIAGCGFGAATGAAACAAAGAATYNAPALATSVDRRACNDAAATY